MQTQDTLVSFRLPADILNELRAIKVRDGIPLSEQLRRGMMLWVAKKEKEKKAGRK